METMAKITVMSPLDAHIGRKVQARRSVMGYSQARLAQAIGVTFQQVQKYEAGVNRVSASRLWKIAGVLRVGVGHFYEDFDEILDDGLPTARIQSPQAVEIARLAPTLSPLRQKLVLAVIEQFSAGAWEDHHGASAANDPRLALVSVSPQPGSDAAVKKAYRRETGRHLPDGERRPIL